MKALIFSEGNGYGHVARDRFISERFGIPIMTFGKGAEYCRNSSLDFIEIPSPYLIHSTKDRVKIVTNPVQLMRFLKPDVLPAIRAQFQKVDVVVVDGSPLGLAVAMLVGKKTVFLTNDTSALVGVQGMLEKKVAGSLLRTLLQSPAALLVPDFPPPLTVSILNLDTSLPLRFTGPLVGKMKHKAHKKKYVVAGPVEKAIRPILGDEAIYGSQVGDMGPYLRDSELVICHGGHTTMMEALSQGKPLLCIVDRAYPERYHNAMAVDRRGVGILLEKNLVSEESLLASIEFAKTLNRQSLKAYGRVAERSSPLTVFENTLRGL